MRNDELLLLSLLLVMILLLRICLVITSAACACACAHKLSNKMDEQKGAIYCGKIHR